MGDNECVGFAKAKVSFCTRRVNVSFALGSASDPWDASKLRKDFA